MKVIKNDIEAKGIRNAHYRDGAALVRYLYWLENEVDAQNITEISGAEKLAQFRRSVRSSIRFETEFWFAFFAYPQSAGAFQGAKLPNDQCRRWPCSPGALLAHTWNGQTYYARWNLFGRFGWSIFGWNDRCDANSSSGHTVEEGNWCVHTSTQRIHITVDSYFPIESSRLYYAIMRFHSFPTDGPIEISHSIPFSMRWPAVHSGMLV